MNEKSGKLFKSKFFGFCKDDVVEYIEKYAKQSEANFLKLQEHNTYLTEQLSEKDALIAKLRGEYEQKAQECEQMQKKLDEATEEASDLNCKIALYEDELSKYNDIRLKLADIEVDAYKRAGEIEQNANRQAKEIFAKSITVIKDLSRALSPLFVDAKDKIKDAEYSLSELKYKINKISPDMFDVSDDILIQAAEQAESEDKTADQLCSDIDGFVKKLKNKQQICGIK